MGCGCPPPGFVPKGCDVLLLQGLGGEKGRLGPDCSGDIGGIHAPWFIGKVYFAFWYKRRFVCAEVVGHEKK